MKERIYKQIEANLSSSIKMKLDNIRNYLSYGNASVMVGAGFSRNADMDETVSMKDWNSLAKIFFQKLYSRTPTGEDLAFKTPMRLASLVETSFGRTELDKMIYESLPDERISPGEIHKAFLNHNTNVAVARAKDLREFHNPSTGIYKLIEMLKENAR